MEFNDVQSNFLKKMSPQQKLEVAMSLYYSAKEFKKAWLRQNNIKWSDQKIEQAVREIFADARS